METILNSSQLGMLSHWTNLVRVEAEDRAVRMVEDDRDWFQHHPVGTYLIETQVNQMGALRAYTKISEKKAAKFMAMSLAQAVRAMELEVFA